MVRDGKLPGIEAYFNRNSEYYSNARKAVEDFPVKSAFDQRYGVINFYTDRIHFNGQPHNGPEDGTIGAYVASITIFSVITGNKPHGLDPKAYSRIIPDKDAELLRAVQDVVWQVVTGNPYAGVN